MTTASASEHGQLINAAAKAHLAPLGMKRKGKSRLWVKDNQWWLALVEFQPSAWGKGSYLNVACMWLWHAKDYYSFDENTRVGGFVEYKEPESFAHAADQLAQDAAGRVLENGARFASLEQVFLHLDAKAGGSLSPWPHYHAMMASLACNRADRAQAHGRGLQETEESGPWCRELKARAEQVLGASHGGAMQQVVHIEVARARALLKLPALDSALLQGAASEA